MNDEEKAIMGRHVNYWLKNYRDDDVVIVYGSVLDPAGAYGVGNISVETEEQVTEITSNNPASEINKYEVYPIMAIVKQI